MQEAAKYTFQNEAEIRNAIRSRIIQPMAAEHVRNEVAWVNPNIAGFDEKLGDDSKFGLMFRIKSDRQTLPSNILYARYEHNRSAIFTFSSDLKYRGKDMNVIDGKGVGWVTDELIRKESLSKKLRRYFSRSKAKQPAIRTSERTTTIGIARYSWALYDAAVCELFADHDLDIVPTVAIIRLSEVMANDGKISVDTAFERNLISRELDPKDNDGFGESVGETDPVIQLRAFVVPFRMSELRYLEPLRPYSGALTELDITRKREIYRTSIEMMQQDQSIPPEIRSHLDETEIYLKWISEKIGKQLGKLHSMGVVHKFLQALHNITIDGKIIDADAAIFRASQQQIHTEYSEIFEDKDATNPNLFGSLKSFLLSIQLLANIKPNVDYIYRY